MQHRARGLDHRPDPDRHVGVDVAEPVGDGREIRDAGNLRHQNAVRLCLAGHGEIVDPPRRIQRVDADQDLAPAESAGRDRLRDLVARQRLGVGRHGILEIENDAVGRQDSGLFQRPRIRSRHEQKAAARTDHGWFPSNPGLPAITFHRPAPKGLSRFAPCGLANSHVIPGTSARGLPDLHLAAAADRTVTLPRTVRCAASRPR